MERIFPKGLIAFAKTEKEPDWKVGTLCITIDDLVDWVATEGQQYLSEYRGKAQLKLQITHTKEGRLSIFVDTYKKDNGPQPGVQSSDATDDLPWG